MTTEWKSVPFWSLFRREKTINHPNEQLLSVYRDLGVILRSEGEGNHNRVGSNISSYQLVVPGDLVVNKMKTWQGSLGVSELRGIVSPAYFVYRPESENISRFLHYALRSAHYVEWYKQISQGVRPDQWDLQPERLSQMLVKLPSVEQQRRIADYLDRETSEIDSMDTDLDRLIETLQERRSTLITSLFAEQPSSLVLLQYLVEFRNGQDYKDVESPLGDVPVIGSGGPFARATSHLYNGESVLFGRKGTIDRPRHVHGKFWTVDTMYFTVLGPHVHGRWLYYWATTVPFALYSTSTALPSMTSSVLGRLPVPLVPLPDQRRIADRLDRETAEIDSMIADARRLKEVLSERRSVLISDVVTGRKEVPA